MKLPPASARSCRLRPAAVGICTVRSVQLDAARADVERLKAQLADCEPEDMPHPVSLRGAWNAMRQDREELKRLRGLVREFAEAKDEYVRFSNVGFPNVGSDRLVASGDALYAAGKEIAK